MEKIEDGVVEIQYIEVCKFENDDHCLIKIQPLNSENSESENSNESSTNSFNLQFKTSKFRGKYRK